MPSNGIPLCVIKNVYFNPRRPGSLQTLSYQRTTHIKNHTPIVTIMIVIGISVKLITGVQLESPCTDVKRFRDMSRTGWNAGALRYRNT